MSEASTPGDLNPYAPPRASSETISQCLSDATGGSDDVRRPRVWPVFTAFGLCIVLDIAIAVAIFAGMAAAQFASAESADFDFNDSLDTLVQSEFATWLIMGCTSLVLAVVSVGGAVLSPVPLLQRLNLRRPQITFFGLVVAIFGTLSVSSIFVAIDGLGLSPKSEALEEIAGIVEDSSPIGFLLSVLLIGLAPGIDEELMFRGYMQTRLVQRWGAGVGILVTSILFGVLHMDLVQGTFAAVMGVFLGYVTVQTRSIVPSMICHAVNNTISTVTTYIGADEISAAEALGDVEADSTSFNLALLGIASTVLALAFWYFSRNAPRDPPDAQPTLADSLTGDQTVEAWLIASDREGTSGETLRG